MYLTIIRIVQLKAIPKLRNRIEYRQILMIPMALIEAICSTILGEFQSRFVMQFWGLYSASLLHVT